MPLAKNYSGASRMSLFLVASIVIFILVLSLAGGVFLWERLVRQNIDDINVRLAKAKEAFDPALVSEFTRLDNRIESSKKILGSHLSASTIFALLEKLTLVNLAFDDFSYSTDVDGAVKVEMRGEARSFNTIALESDAFTKSPFIRNPIFSNLNLDSSGNVIFTFNASLDPSLISYSKNVLSENTSNAAPQSVEVGNAEGEGEGSLSF